MTARAPAEVRILASVGFRQARMQATSTSRSAATLRELLALVDSHLAAETTQLSNAARLNLDILYAVVDARAEDLEHPTPAVVDVLTITAAARLHLVVATLLYITKASTYDPTLQPQPEEVAALLRWAIRAAYQELPVSS